MKKKRKYIRHRSSHLHQTRQNKTKLDFLQSETNSKNNTLVLCIFFQQFSVAMEADKENTQCAHVSEAVGVPKAQSSTITRRPKPQVSPPSPSLAHPAHVSDNVPVASSSEATHTSAVLSASRHVPGTCNSSNSSTVKVVKPQASLSTVSQTTVYHPTAAALPPQSTRESPVQEVCSTHTTAGSTGSDQRRVETATRAARRVRTESAAPSLILIDGIDLADIPDTDSRPFKRRSRRNVGTVNYNISALSQQSASPASPSPSLSVSPSARGAASALRRSGGGQGGHSEGDAEEAESSHAEKTKAHTQAVRVQGAERRKGNSDKDRIGEGSSSSQKGVGGKKARRNKNKVYKELCVVCEGSGDLIKCRGSCQHSFHLQCIAAHEAGARALHLPHSASPSANAQPVSAQTTATATLPGVEVEAALGGAALSAVAIQRVQSAVQMSKGSVTKAEEETREGETKEEGGASSAAAAPVDAYGHGLHHQK